MYWFNLTLTWRNRYFVWGTRLTWKLKGFAALLELTQMIQTGKWKSESASRDGAVMGALISNQCGLGSIPARRHIWVEFVLGSRLSSGSEGFSSGFSVFLPPLKLKSPNSNSTSTEDPMYSYIYFCLLRFQKFLFRTEYVLADWNEKSCSII